MELSQRIQNMPTSPIRKLTPYQEKAVRENKKIYHLNIGQPDIVTPRQFFEEIENTKIKVLEYAPSAGIPELRKSVSEYYASHNIPFAVDEINITNGGSEALMFAMMIVADPGDEILTCEPYYTNYNSFFHEAGVCVNTFPTKVEEGFHLPKREIIERAITEKTRAILLSNPSNPTGVVYTKDELELIADIAIKHDLFILSDEVYREFTYDGQQFCSFASIERIADRLLLLDSVSKRYSACGARIGSIATKNKDVAAAALKLCQGRLAAPTMEQIGAVGLYKTDKSYLDEVNQEYNKRRDCIYEELCNIPDVTCYKPQGAFYTMASLPVEDAEQFCIWMLDQFSLDNETVMMTPAMGFYQHTELGKNQVRLAYVLNTDDLKRAMHLLKKGLEAYPHTIRA